MKTYIVYNSQGVEVWYKPNQQYLKAGNHNTAENKAKKLHGSNASVCYTEI